MQTQDGITFGELLGSGGNGLVYEGTDTQGKRIAVKIPVSEEGKSRLYNEVALLSQLHHPHILTLEKLIQLDQGPAAILPIMKGPLDTSVPRSIPECSSIIAQIADGLAYAHAHGIIHNDIKPSNILQKTANAYVLADFGFAQPRPEDIVISTPFPVNGIGGTRQYSSPEARAGNPTPQSDIYSLTAVFYELLTNRKVDHEFEPVLKEKAISEHLCALLRRGLAPAETRYSTVNEFLQDLHPNIAPQQTEATIGASLLEIERLVGAPTKEDKFTLELMLVRAPDPGRKKTATTKQEIIPLLRRMSDILDDLSFKYGAHDGLFSKGLASRRFNCVGYTIAGMTMAQSLGIPATYLGAEGMPGHALLRIRPRDGPHFNWDLQSSKEETDESLLSKFSALRECSENELKSDQYVRCGELLQQKNKYAALACFDGAVRLHPSANAYRARAQFWSEMAQEMDDKENRVAEVLCWDNAIADMTQSCAYLSPANILFSTQQASLAMYGMQRALARPLPLRAEPPLNTLQDTHNEKPAQA